MIYHTTNTKMPVKWVDNSPRHKKRRYPDDEVSPICYILMLNYLIHDSKAGIAPVSWIFILQ